MEFGKAVRSNDLEKMSFDFPCLEQRSCQWMARKRHALKLHRVQTGFISEDLFWGKKENGLESSILLTRLLRFLEILCT